MTRLARQPRCLHAADSRQITTVENARAARNTFAQGIAYVSAVPQAERIRRAARPENTQSALRTRKAARSPSSPPPASRCTLTSRPTLFEKWATARAETPAAFYWKAYGVSSTTASAMSRSREKSDLCTVTIVGLVSPEPAIARIRQPAGRTVTSVSSRFARTVLVNFSLYFTARHHGDDLGAVSKPERAGTTTAWSSPPSTAPPTSGKCSSACARRQESAMAGHLANCAPRL